MQHQRQTQIGSRESGMIPMPLNRQRAQWEAKQMREDGGMDIACNGCGAVVQLNAGEQHGPQFCTCKAEMTNWKGLPINYVSVTGEHRVPTKGTPCHDFPTDSGEFPYPHNAT
ncbi:hypothetical protein KGQ24_01720 [Patescibacteria group bacterium]|nr:hypothetical protein [Patescibacteria group bacterium]